MGRLIDADALKEHMGIVDATKHENKNAQRMLNSYGTLMRYEIADYIDDMPTIDAAPVRRGEWKYVPYQTDKATWITGEFACPRCGGRVPRRMGDNPPSYCKHCGADMRGEVHE